MNQRTEQEAINEITEALATLELHHQETGNAIRKLSEELKKLQGRRCRGTNVNRRHRREIRITKEDCENLLGHEVRIVNPGRNEPDQGYIHSVGKVFITVDIGEGVRKQRIAKNLRLLEYDQRKQRRRWKCERSRRR